MVTGQIEPNNNQTLNEHDAAGYLGLKMGGLRLLVDLADVIEVLPVPAIQAVPMTEHWFLGVSNVRGNLVSISDLAWLMGRENLVIKPASRILLLNSVRTTQSAIVLDGVLGLQQVSSMSAVPLDYEDQFQAFYDFRYWFEPEGLENAKGQVWLQLNVDHLLSDGRFLQPGLGK